MHVSLVALCCIWKGCIMMDQKWKKIMIKRKHTTWIIACGDTLYVISKPSSSLQTNCWRKKIIIRNIIPKWKQEPMLLLFYSFFFFDKNVLFPFYLLNVETNESNFFFFGKIVGASKQVWKITGPLLEIESFVKTWVVSSCQLALCIYACLKERL